MTPERAEYADGVPREEAREMRAELDRLERLNDAILLHAERHEWKRAVLLYNEVKRRQRDLDIQISFWEEKLEELS